MTEDGEQRGFAGMPIGARPAKTKVSDGIWIFEEWQNKRSPLNSIVRVLRAGQNSRLLISISAARQISDNPALV